MIDPELRVRLILRFAQSWPIRALSWLLEKCVPEREGFGKFRARERIVDMQKVRHTFCAISDPKNQHVFTKEAAYKAFQHVRGDGDPEVLKELSASERTLHDE